MQTNKTQKLCSNMKKCLEELSYHGDAEFLYAMARSYRKGLFVDQNVNEAIKILKISKDKLSSKSMWRLGRCYDKHQDKIEGLTKKQCKEEMIKYYKMAVESGDPYAQNDLARHYFKGVKSEEVILLERNAFEAFRLVREAIKADNFMAYKTLADEYYEMGLYIEAMENYTNFLDNCQENDRYPKSNYEKMVKNNMIRCEKVQVNNKREAIFISYSHKNMENLKELCNFLLSNNVDANNLWWDIKIKPGERLSECINENLSKTAVAIILLSNDYLKSHYCVNVEWKNCFAVNIIDNRIKLVILPLEKCDHSLLEKYGFSDINAVQYLSSPLNYLSDSDKDITYKKVLNIIN